MAMQHEPQKWRIQSSADAEFGAVKKLLTHALPAMTSESKGTEAKVDDIKTVYLEHGQ
jgi:hypothetical protein